MLRAGFAPVTRPPPNPMEIELSSHVGLSWSRLWFAGPQTKGKLAVLSSEFWLDKSGTFSLLFSFGGRIPSGTPWIRAVDAVGWSVVGGNDNDEWQPLSGCGCWVKSAWKMGESDFFVFFWMEKADSFEYHHECEKDKLFSVRRTDIMGSLLDT